MAAYRTIKITLETYDRLNRLRERFLKEGRTREEGGRVLPMTLSGILNEALDALDNSAQPKSARHTRRE